MQTSNAKQNSRSNDPVWGLAAELSLGDFLSDHDRREGPSTEYLFQIAQKLGMPPECMENIAKTLAGFAKEAFVRDKQGKRYFPGRIRIFCQKKLSEEENSAKTSGTYHTKQGKKHAENFPDPGVNRNGGWGYFMIEQSDDLPSCSPAIPHTYVDLYLYKEGE